MLLCQKKIIYSKIYLIYFTTKYVVMRNLTYVKYLSHANLLRNLDTL